MWHRRVVAGLARRRRVLVLGAGAIGIALAAFTLGVLVGRGPTNDDVADDVPPAESSEPTSEPATDPVENDAGDDDGDGDANDAADDEGNAGDGPTLGEVLEPIDIGPTEGTFDGTGFVATFDGEPEQPRSFNPDNWDVTVHSRAPETWLQLDLVDADHGPACSAPPDTHTVTSYEDTVYMCKNHMMTSIRGDAYGVIYLTPPYQVDFSDETAVISLDMSTLRSSTRDWWDIWISPYDDALQLPLELDASADLTGPPKNAIRVGLGPENQMLAEIYEDFEKIQFPDWPFGSVSGDTWTGYETFLDPDLRRRDTFEVHLSQTHLKVGMPQYDFWWIDTDIPEVDWSTGVVQFGHHSYNPTKDCNRANNPRPVVDECLPTTWHWDNLSISPAVPFTVLRADQRAADATAPAMTFAEPAPANANLRFAGIGIDMMVRFDDGSWQPATVQETVRETADEHFASYWLEVPTGTTSVEFSAEDWFAGPWHVRDASFWSLDP